MTPYQGGAVSFTGIHPNGRQWLSMSGWDRSVYVIATRNAVMEIAQCGKENKAKSDVLFPLSLGIPEVKCAVDEFYASSGNILVPTIEAITVVAEQTAVHDTSALILEMRKEAVAAVSAKSRP